MQSLQKCILAILLVFWIEPVTVFSATVDSASFYQRSNDGSYRYGYNAGGGFNARQSANSANEVIGQYAQLQPDGRIVNVRYKAGVGGFQPQYSAALNGAALGGPGSLGGQLPRDGSYGGGSLGAVPFGSRSLGSGPSFGPGSYNIPRAGLPNGGSNNGAYLGPGSPASRSPIGGSLGAGSPGSGSLAPGSIGSRSPVGGSGSGPFGSGTFGGRPYPGAGLAGTPYRGAQYPGPRYAVTPAYGGALGIPRQPPVASVNPTPQPFSISTTPAPIHNTGPLGDGSYRFSYANDESSRTESGDPSGTVRGTYSFQNDAGNHDLSYVAGPKTGFRPIGGSLAAPNGLPKQVISTTTTPVPVTVSQSGPRNDGTYNFAYRTPDSTRQESADNRGNVHGSYSFRNEDGAHDLSFVAGPTTGFQPTGGSLAVPNGLGQRRPSIASSTSSPIGTTFPTTMVRNDSPERSFQVEPVSIRNDPANGNGVRSGLEFEPTEKGVAYTNGRRQFFSTTVRPVPLNYQNNNGANLDGSPRYSYQNGGSVGQGSNGAGGNGQRYGGGVGNSFRPVEGNLANSNSLPGVGTGRPEEDLRDGSYGFPNTTPNYGSYGDLSDGQQNFRVPGGTSSNNGLSFDQRNGLNYGAGAGRGLSSNGGSFANSYGLSGGGGQNFGTQPANTNRGSDGSYNFSYDTGRQAHQENRDGRGGVDGRYSYLSDGGQRSLSYRVRPGTGFQVTGGNLASKTPK